MKTSWPLPQGLVATTVFMLALTSTLTVAAQTGPGIPVVIVRAPDPSAAEPSDQGRFVLLRDGPTNMALNVYCVLGGTASNGVDYTTIPNFIPIPAGVREVPILVRPIDDVTVEAPESVVLRLAPSPLMPPINYIIGNASNAVVTILDNDSPPPPPLVTVQAVDPHASEPGLLAFVDVGVFVITRTGQTNFNLPVHYTISGTASNGVDYTRISNSVVIPAGRAAVEIVINALHDLLPEGMETVVLRLEDIACIAIYPPPPECYQVGTPREAVVFIADNDQPANFPPDAKITKPLDGQTFVAPVNVLLRVETKDRDGYVDHVEFYAGTNLIGQQTRYLLTPPPPGQLAVFEMVWTNPPVSRHELRVKARDDQGTNAWSQPVTIWVVNTNLPPPPPIVTISAPDPVASEGTNCYQIMIYPPPTNNPCVSNTATFVIRRAGPTNAALTVHYRIDGTASNGVDYVELPGVVTIPAGRRAAEFKVVPIDDALRERVETVVLRLCVPPTATAAIPPYVIGCPGRAAAIIVDNDEPRPETGPLPDRCFHVMKPGANGTWWRIECSTNMNEWTPICTIPVIDGAIDFVDPDADELPNRFYRAVPDSAPPPE